ncbi:transposase [Dysgonomonas gadei]|uniref:transposase n=1 Tax=Dysgonomonas gadei TaxID=156974 RepID=UPI000693BDC2
MNSPKRYKRKLFLSPIHRSKLFKNKIKEWVKDDLYICFLPPYSPELNKIEILWRFIKYRWLPFETFVNFKNLKERLKFVLENIGTKCSVNFY